MYNPCFPVIDFEELEKFPELWNNELVNHSQVWRRAERLSINRSLTQKDFLQVASFTGGYTTQENSATSFQAPGVDLLQSLESSKPAESGTFQFANLSDLVLDFSILPAPNDTEYALMLSGCTRILIRNLHLNSLHGSGIYLGDSSYITIQNCSFSNLGKAGIVIGNGSHHISVCDNLISDCGGAGVFIGEGSHHIIIERNKIIDGKGKSNWAAGIVLTDRHSTNLQDTVSSIFGPDGYWAYPIPIFDRDRWVGACRIVNNVISGNLASGVYIDGGLDNVLMGNFISGNSKEGICLDYGATRNIVCFNSVQLNGNRFGKTDEDLAKDFVLHHGRSEDGTPSAKVPGISLDNALFNLVQYNWFIGNFGSGIKMVRTSFLNAVAYNIITENNLGMNSRNHFFGIEIGAALSDGATLPGVAELDFLPSSHNLLYRNIIHKGHFSGIFFDGKTQGNILFDNSMHENEQWSMEAVDRTSSNASLNNFSTQNSKNIGLSTSVAMTIGLGQVVS